MNKHLHIICLTVPYPVDYGGVFDLYYKLPFLKDAGIKIHLHCFDYGRGKQGELEKFCEEVFYYPRNSRLSIRYPFIVSSRRNNELLKRLLADDYPILMEGIHCTYLLNDRRFAGRKCFVRLHNVEHIYYYNLFRNEASLLKKAYYLAESLLLRRYEKKIAPRATFLSVIEKDARVFNLLGSSRAKYLPLFLPPWHVSPLEGKGFYCLYQGDLSVAENEAAVLWLLKMFDQLPDIPLVLAGKNPSRRLVAIAHKKEHVCLIANPTESEMQDLIKKSHINIVPSLNATGIKLKMLNALYNGRFCLANTAAVEGTGLADMCHIADEPQEFVSLIKALYKQDFSAADAEKRRNILSTLFNNRHTASHLINIIWNEPESIAYR